jgi:hypothetical protein
MEAEGSLLCSQKPATEHHSEPAEFNPLLRSCQRISSGPRRFGTFRNILNFYGEGLLVPRQTPILEDHPLSAVRDCLFNIRSYPPYLEAFSIRNLRTHPAVVTKDPPNMLVLLV